MNKFYIDYMHATQKSENTIKNYVKYIEEMLKYIKKPENEIEFVDLMNYQASLSHLSPNSVRLRIAAIKNYFNFLVKAKVIIESPAATLEKPKINPKEKHYMTEKDIRAMLNNARTMRDKAIVKFMVSTGVRIGEMISITLDDYYKAINNNHEITIVGKGNKERNIYINNSVEKEINNYLKNRDDNCPYLFCSFQRTQINPESMSKTLKNMAKKAGIPFWKDISNHALRAATATIMNEKGVGVATISKALGHSSLAVTSLYIKNTQSNINNAMQNMTF